MDLPGRPGRARRAGSLAANPRTVVVRQHRLAGDDALGRRRAPRCVQMWFGGQEMAGALADVLTGEAEPGGRLPTTFPVRLEHNPSYGNFPGENGEVRYGEGLLVGYRWYEARQLPTRYPFGHGLSYSTFEIGEPTPSTSSPGAPGRCCALQVPVTNTGGRRGSEVVQAYVAAPLGRVVRPARQLRAFAKVAARSGRDHHGRARPRQPVVRVVGPGRARVGGRARALRGAPRSVVGRHRSDRRRRRRRRSLPRLTPDRQPRTGWGGIP